MASLKQNISIRVAGVNQDGTASTAAITSDAIEFVNNEAWSFNVWFTGLTFTAGKPPTITIEVSNDTDTNSFTPLSGGTVVNTPVYIDSEFSKWRYMRIIYDPQNATGGTKNFDLVQI